LPPSVSQLTSRPDSVLSKCRRSRHPIPTQIATAPSTTAGGQNEEALRICHFDARCDRRIQLRFPAKRDGSGNSQDAAGTLPKARRLSFQIPGSGGLILGFRLQNF
jgi:hypothetical protein